MTAKTYLRPAIITNVDPVSHTVLFKYLDRTENKDYKCSIAHPYAGPGWGVLAMPSKGTRVMIGHGVLETPYIVSIVALNQYSEVDFSSQGSQLTSVSVDEFQYPSMQPGEVALQGISGSKIHMLKNGDINFSISDSAIEYSETNKASERFDSKYTNTEAFRHISGAVLRDIREKNKQVEESTDRLSSISYDKTLTAIGKNPLHPVANRTLNQGTSRETIRNPSLVENRTLTYEFTRTSMVENYSEEVERIKGVEDDTEKRRFLSQPNRRDMLRTDVLNLGLHLPNNLIEKIEGTVVDIYGNILDINRNRIDFSQATSKNSETSSDIFSERMQTEHKLLRRSIKYHFELNAKKETLEEQSSSILDGVSESDQATKTGYSHSRLSLDIDGEGFVKLNIPANSNYGNVPLLSRYINNFNGKDRNTASFRSEDTLDIAHIPFGQSFGGVAVNDNYLPKSTTSDRFSYRTAYHDIATTAFSVLESPCINTSLSNEITSASANAGGRSLHANFDGSVELNIGRDVIDKKSLVIDTAGSIISRIGKDVKSNSIVSHMDGNINIQVGGDTVSGEQELVFNKFSFFIKAESGYHKVEINETGIVLTSATNTNIILDSSNNLILKAAGQVLIAGSTVNLYGTYSNNGDDIVGQRLALPNGQQF